MLLSPQGVTDVHDAGGARPAHRRTQQAGPRAGSTGRGWGRHRPCCALHSPAQAARPLRGCGRRERAGTSSTLTRLGPGHCVRWVSERRLAKARDGLRGVGPRGGSRSGLPPSLRSGLLPGEAVPPQRMLSIHTHPSTSTARAPGLPASPPCRRTMSSGRLPEPASGSLMGPSRPGHSVILH